MTRIRVKSGYLAGRLTRTRVKFEANLALIAVTGWTGDLKSPLEIKKGRDLGTNAIRDRRLQRTHAYSGL